MKSSPPLRKRSLKALFELKPYLDRINNQVEESGYIQHDPVQFMHAFSAKKDMEIAGFLAATMAWGRRDIVVAKVDNLLSRMNYAPFDFIMSYRPAQFERFRTFKHRTFKPIDVHGLISGLQKVYEQYEDLEAFWQQCYQKGVQEKRPLLAVFHDNFFSLCDDLADRTRKHISNPEKGSTCKRLYMYLRWVIRKNSPVDLGIWNFMESSDLLIPFDVHVARQARRYGLLTRRTNDWKSVHQLTETLRLLNPDDPACYDYALFGIGALNHKLPERFLLNRI